MKVRLIVAGALIPVLLIVILLLPTVVTAVLLCLMAAIGAYELLWRTRLVSNIRIVIYTMLMAAFVPLWCHHGMEYGPAIVAILLYTVLMFSELLLSHAKQPFDQIAIGYVGAILIPFLLSALVRIINQEHGRYYILLPFVLAFSSDSGAYFAGRFFGRHKLAPVISPNKTVEGVIGGVVATVVIMMLYCVILNFGFDFKTQYLYALSYGVLGSLAAVFGDLIFSAVKRQTGIKDYGNLLPGHGGILDRFDSMTVVAPLTEVLLMLLPVVEK